MAFLRIVLHPTVTTKLEPQKMDSRKKNLKTWRAHFMRAEANAKIPDLRLPAAEIRNRLPTWALGPQSAA